MKTARTSRNTVNLVLNKEVNERHQGSEKATGKVLAILDCRRVVGAESDAAGGPWQCGDNVGDHENVVPVVVIGRGNVGPTAAGQGAQDTHGGDEAWQLGAGLAGQEVP